MATTEAATQERRRGPFVSGGCRIAMANVRASSREAASQNTWEGGMSDLERTMNEIDCSLYRVLCAVENEWAKLPPGRTRNNLGASLQHLRSARTPIRMLMSDRDREQTS